MTATYQTPVLQHAPSVLSGEDLQRIEAEVNSTVEVKLTLYEELAKRYHDHPYFLARIAAVYESSRCFSMAEDVYRTTRSKIREMDFVDQVLDKSIERVTRLALQAANQYLEADRQLSAAGKGWNPSPHPAEDLLTSVYQGLFKQPWQNTQKYRFPMALPHPPEGHEQVFREWNSLTSDASAKYFIKLAIDTNEVENAFRLTADSTQDLVRNGISESAIRSDLESVLHDARKIKDILCDTIAAYDLLRPLLTGPKVTLTPEFLCDIHARLMKTARFNPNGTETIVAGKTRTFTRTNVVVGGSQCCPFPQVNQELEHICRMANARVSQWISSWRNPFATASWIHLVFVQCHPFEDGNGRLGRMLASIPLMRHRYPPIVISLEGRQDYFDAIKKAFDNDHTPFVDCTLKGMQETLL